MSFSPVSSMLFIARVDRSDWRAPTRWVFSGFQSRRPRLLRLRPPGRTSDCRMLSESLVSSSSSSLSSSSKARTGIGCLAERRVGSETFFFLHLRFLPVPSLSSSLLASSIGSLRWDRLLDARPFLFAFFASLLTRLLGGLPLRRGASSTSSSRSSSSEEEMSTVVMSTKPSLFALEVLPRSLMSSASGEEASSYCW